MKICVHGIWHLGAVTAACLAEAGFTTVGLAADADAAAKLTAGTPPLFEPGLEDLFRSGLAGGKLSFTADAQSAVGDADIIWVTFDTPVDDEDHADVDYVLAQITQLFPHLRDQAIVLVSSQMPVGSLADIERRFAAVAKGRQVIFACSPENLRLGKALDVFRKPERIIVGLRGEQGKPKLTELLQPFCSNIIWMRVESAELSKHALNAFLATSVTFINEIATIAETLGADAGEVEQALRSEPRIGAKAYIRPGAAFAGGTLARDVHFINQLAAAHDLALPMIGNILASNHAHADWPLRCLRRQWGDKLSGRKIALLGLAYKPGTDSLRRSLSVKLLHALCAAGAHVTAYDPKVTELPDAPAGLTLATDMTAALTGAEALIIMTEWPEFQKITADMLAAQMAAPMVLDQNRFLGHLAGDSRIDYITIGKTA